MSIHNPITFSVNKMENYIRINFPESVSVEDMKVFEIALFKNPELRPDFNVLLIIEPIKKYSSILNTLGLIKYGQKIASNLKKSKWAIVIDDYSTHRAFDIMEDLLENSKIRIGTFIYEEDAKFWLIKDRILESL